MSDSGKQKRFGWLEVVTAAITAFLVGNGVFSFLKSVGIPSFTLPGFNSIDYGLSPLIFLGFLGATAIIYVVLQAKKLPVIIGYFTSGITLISGFYIGLLASISRCVSTGSVVNNSPLSWDATRNCYSSVVNPNFAAPDIVFGTALWVTIIMLLYMIAADWIVKRKPIYERKGALPYKILEK